MDKKILISIIVILIIAASIGAYFVFQKPASESQTGTFPQPQAGKCGDGICDTVEKANLDLCPKDCKETDTGSKENSPFGIHEVKFYMPKDVEALKDLGIKSTRNAPQNNIIWSEIEKERGKYSWSYSDGTITTAYNLGIKTFITVGPARKPGATKLPNDNDLNWFLEFLGKAVERYDGDGIDDAPGSPKIDVIQIYNEVDGPGFWNDTPENYAILLKKSYQTVKKVAPNMKVSIAGTATPAGFYKDYMPILEELNRIKDNPNDQYFDVFDFHWFGQFIGEYSEIILPGGNYEMKKFVIDIKSELDKIGYKNVGLYITEMADYSGTPASNPKAPVKFEVHSEKQHASSLIKRYVYSLVAGIDKIYWSQIVETHNYGGVINGYFDNVGLINNPLNDGQSHKKLAYYTYKKMVEILEGSDWKNIQIIQEKDGIYIYKFIKDGKPIWVVWNDNGGSKQITISGITSSQVKVTEAVPKYESGKEVTDYNSAFNAETKTVSGGKATITLGESPVFVETQ